LDTPLIARCAFSCMLALIPGQLWVINSTPFYIICRYSWNLLADYKRVKWQKVGETYQTFSLIIFIFSEPARFQEPCGLPA
jgi:hypothetical protein